MVKYTYLADGTKLSALDVDGEGLVYRGPFVYRQSSGGEGDSSLTFESASFGGGLLTSSGVLLYVKDYLGSVRAVLDADSGALYKAVDYSAYGDAGDVKVSVSGSSHPIASASLPSGLTLRDGYTGKEDQHVDFGTGYVDFGARQYSPALHRWLVPDPLSEKFYGISPYAFCNSNPMNYVDVDGEFPDIIWDLASIGMGAKSLVDNVRAGNTRAAIGDGVGIVIDAFAAAVPFVPGGVGAIRTGAKVADMADDVVDAARGADTAINNIYRDIPNPKNAGPGKATTAKQRKLLLERNMEINGGVLRSDGDGRVLNMPHKSVKGMKADMNQAEVDHIVPKSKGGKNTNDNLQILSKEENLKKSNIY